MLMCPLVSFYHTRFITILAKICSYTDNILPFAKTNTQNADKSGMLRNIYVFWSQWG